MTTALLGFLPWADAARGVDVRENPSILAVERASALVPGAVPIGVTVSHEGVLEAVRRAEQLGARVVVAVGQTPTGPRLERCGRVPSVLAPARAGEGAPWLLAPDAEALVRFLNAHAVVEAGTAPFAVSDDAGGYYCDHLCVELARLSRRTGAEARFLHVTAIDGCDASVREARLEQYARQVAAVARYLEGCVWWHSGEMKRAARRRTARSQCLGGARATPRRPTP